MAVRWPSVLGGVVVAVAVILIAVGAYTTVQLVRDPARLQSAQGGLNVTYVGPNASFAWSSNGYNVTLTDTSTDRGAAITAWVWEFGDGTAASNVSPVTHTYTETCGSCVVTVTLGVQDAQGRQSAATANVLLVHGGNANGVGLSPTSQFHAPALTALSSGVPQALESVVLMFLIGGSVANAGRQLLRNEPEGVPVPVRRLDG